MSTIAVAESVSLISATWVYWNAGINKKNISIKYNNFLALNLTPMIIALFVIAFWIVSLPSYIYFSYKDKQKVKKITTKKDKAIQLFKCFVFFIFFVFYFFIL